MAKRTSLTKTAFKGVNNKKDPARLDSDELAKAQNVDIDDTGKIASRKGRTQVLAGDNFHSLWPSGFPKLGYALGINDGNLVRIDRANDGTYSKTTLRSAMTLGKPMSFAYVNGDIYYSNGINNGVIRDGVNKPWGLPVPSNPVLSTATGTLYAGRYQVTLTYFDADGRESGARKGSQITLSGVSGITISGIPSHSDASHVGIYMTPPNGAAYYRVAKVANGTSSHTVSSGRHWTIDLQTLFMVEPPLGNLIAYDNGRIYIVDAVDPRVLWMTLPMSYHLVDSISGYLFFEHDITFLHAQPESGLVVGADQTYWIPTNFESVEAIPRRTLATYKSIGTGQVMDGEDLGTGLTGKWSVWMTENGPCRIGPGGRGFANLTEQQFAPPPGSEAAVLVRKYNGYVQMLNIIRVNFGSQNIHVTDEMSATVRKNEITL